MSVCIRWGVIKSTASPAPLLEVPLSVGYRERIVKGLFDTGADFTNLDPVWKEKLRVQPSSCMPWEIKVASGEIIHGELTVLGASLDGHSFRMPVVFLPNVPTDLFGRVGILDQFKIDLDPVNMWTTFTWVGPHGAPWAQNIEALWREKVQPVQA